MTTAAVLSTATDSPAPAAGRLLSRLLAGAPELVLNHHQHPDRQQVENYIAGKFADEHNAQISHFMPLLLTVSCLKKYSAAVGLRTANDKLFVDHYLPEGAFAAVQALDSNKQLHRQQVVEIGNLVSTQRGSSQLLFIILTSLLHKAGAEWVIFTATRQVQQLLVRLNLPTISLCTAEKSRLGDQGEHWGSYYDNQPEVMAIKVDDAFYTLIDNRFARIIMQQYQHTTATLAHSFRAAQFTGV